MSDSDDNITPFRLPESSGGEDRETFGERLRRRRRELGAEERRPPHAPWRTRRQTLVAFVVESPHAAATITRRSADEARKLDGVEAVLFASDLPPFQNTLGRDFSSEPLLAEDEVRYRGQPVALVVATDEATCRLAASRLDIDYHTEPGILTLDQALALESFHGEPRLCERGKAIERIESSPKQIRGTFSIPPQLVTPPPLGGITVRPEVNGGAVFVEANALLPTSVRTAVALAAELPESEVHLEPVDLPGLTGALETQPVRLAALATHAMRRCGNAIRILLSSSDSPLATGCRHETRALFEAGFAEDGTINAVNLRIALDGGWFEADSANVMDRALLHADSVYRIPHLRLSTRLARTNRLVSSCMPAEGAAQGAWAMEEIVERIAEALGRPAHEIRGKNFYQEDGELKTTPYGQPVQPHSLSRVWNQVLNRSNFEKRLEQVDRWNRRNASCKRGIAALPIKFGIGDPRPERNAAATIVQILADGSVLVRAGIVNVNDGLVDQIREEVAGHLGIEEEAIRVILNDFDSLPRATPVTGTDAAGLVLHALEDACLSLLKRLREVALQLFAARGQTEIELESIRFAGGLAGPNVSPANPLHFKEVVEGAWRKRVNLIETGYHRTPNLWWDPELGAGWPFTAFTWAAAVAEIQVDAFTGEIEILRLDVAHEGSPSPNQNDRDFAQLIRSFELGTGWMLYESAPDPESPDPHVPEHRGIPGFADAPFQVETDRLRPVGDPRSTPGDPCGEAPVLLAGALREALRHALRAFGLAPELEIDVPLPATPPRVLRTFREISRKRPAGE